MKATEARFYLYSALPVQNREFILNAKSHLPNKYIKKHVLSSQNLGLFYVE